MATERLTMPRLGETMEEGRLVTWLKAPGEAFVRGEILAEVETDKTVVELPALNDGRLVATLVEPGDDVAVDAPIAEIEVAGAEAGENEAGVEQTQNSPPRSPLQAPPTNATTTNATSGETPPAPSRGPDAASATAQCQKVRATPLARRLARQHGIPLDAITGTGRRGRVDAADVRAHTGLPEDVRVGAPAKDATDGSRPAAPSADPTSRPSPRPAALTAKTGDGEPQRFSIFGGTLACAVHGRDSDPPVLLLHGFSGFNGSWAAFPARLAANGRRVIVPDLPAHGDTTLPADTAEDLAAPLPNLLDMLDVDAGQVEVVGHSLGGVVAMRLAETLIAQESRPRRISLLAPAGMGREIDRSFIRAMASGPSAGALAHLLRQVATRDPGLSQEVLEARAAALRGGRLKALAATLASPAGQGVDIVASLGKIARTVPSRMGFGVRDAIIPWTHVESAPSTVAIHLFQDAGHMIHWDAPEALAELLATEG